MEDCEDLKLEISQEGYGPLVEVGDIVSIFYRVKLADGKDFDDEKGSEYYTKEYFEVGKDEVIKPWDEAFIGMQQGTQARITTPLKYAYGSENVPDDLIPDNSSLIFDVEVVGVSKGNKN